MTRKKKARKQTKSTEQLRQEAIKQADANIAAIEAKERGETPPAKPKTKSKKTKAAKAPRAKAAKPADKKQKKLSGLDAAAKVLAASTEPLNAVTIAERAIAAGWKTNGATPHATLYAAMIREIAAKGKASRFVKKDRGLFTAAPGGKGA